MRKSNLQGTMAVSKEMKVTSASPFVLGSIFGTMTSVKGMIPISHYCPMKWQNSHGIHQIEQWLRTVGPANPWICRYSRSNATPLNVPLDFFSAPQKVSGGCIGKKVIATTSIPLHV